MAGREAILRERRAVLEVLGFIPLAFDQQVGLGDGKGLGVDLLSVKVDGNVLLLLPGDLVQRFFRHGEHAARAAGAVIHQVGGGLDLIGDRQQDQARHQAHHVARGEVLAGFFVVLLVEAADQLFEDGAHGVVIQPGQLVHCHLRATPDPG